MWKTNIVEHFNLLNMIKIILEIAGVLFVCFLIFRIVQNIRSLLEKEKDIYLKSRKNKSSFTKH